MVKVLIVDDDKFTRSVIEKILVHDPAVRHLQVQVTSASDGDEALARFAADRPDFIVVDLQLPKGRDGFEVCALLRSQPGGEHIPLAVLGGVYRDASVADRLEREFGAKLFTKPYQLRGLSQYMVGALGMPVPAAPSPPGMKVPMPAKPGTSPPPIPSNAAASRKPLTAPPKPQGQQGDLAERSLPAVLLDLWEAEATGRLSLRRGKVAKEVDLVVGHPRSVASNVRDETLGHFLLARGVINKAQHDEAMNRAATQKEKVGSALIAIGALTTQDLIQQLTAQARFKLMRALRWNDGSWSFQPSAQTASGFHGEALEMLSVVLRGLKRTASIEPLPPRVAALRGRVLRLNARGTSMVPAARRIFGAPLLEHWRDGATPEQMIEAGMDRVGLFTLLEVLVLCDALTAEAGAASVTADTGDALSVGDLFDHSQVLRSNSPAAETAQSHYASLFGDETTGVDLEQIASGAVAAPIEPDDSGVLAVVDSLFVDPALADARKQLLDEYLRIQGGTHYEVLGVERKASGAQIAAAAMERMAKFSADLFGRYDLGRDYVKLEEIHEAYERSRRVLMDVKQRAEHDHELTQRERAGRPPTLEAEIGFRAAEDLLAVGQHGAALERLEASVAAAPNEATYHAALGWARFAAGGRNAASADAALPHLNQALAINPDHPGAHEYKGIIFAAIGNDDALAVLHLERALDADPTRDTALESMEEVWRRRGEVRPLERQYRRMLFRLTGRDPEREFNLWVKVANLYRNELDDVESARIAYASAARLHPDNQAIQATLADIESGTLDRFHERAQDLRLRWRKDPTSPAPAVELFEHAVAAARFDVAFVTASALVAVNAAPPDAQELYQRFRPRFVIRAQRVFEAELWDEVRHPDDSVAIGHLFALLEPVVQGAMRLDLADHEVREGTRIEDEDLPAAFLRLRAYAAHMLGVQVPPVYSRPDFGHQIHVAAVSPPVLLVGDDALSSPERSELSFRLGRAMSYLRPGRTMASSQPARLLKQVMLASFAATHQGGADDGDATVGELTNAISLLDSEALAEVSRLLEYMRSENRTINLSRWTRAMGRTGDRVGLVLCGDLPAAVRFSRETAEAESLLDLLDFAISPSFGKLRQQMGLSIDV
ncbi:MAG TPA: response regulator [Kofleriaceae bacterium]|nr:response regulator [Kofleriaceae bacterium]